MNIILFLLIGALAGWIAGELMQGRGFGLLGDILVGIAGALVGGLIFNFLGISTGPSLAGELITSVIGAVVFLFVVGFIRRETVTR